MPRGAREKGADISLYSGLNMIINSELMISVVVERHYVNSGNRGSEIIYNLGLKYNFSEFLSIGANFQYTRSKEINPTDKASRSLRIGYQNIFY